ncbi:MAG: hypothetical protein EBU34_09095 [Alphaproteobacteria bacterium]|nr:hypothetical protein [Alphaproteobacteria bacterium]
MAITLLDSGGEIRLSIPNSKPSMAIPTNNAGSNSRPEAREFEKNVTGDSCLKNTIYLILMDSPSGQVAFQQNVKYKSFQN